MQSGTKFCLMESEVSAGFPSPAEDHIDRRLDLNEKLVPNAPSTFLVRVRGTSMIGVGILSGDVLVVDRSLDPRDGQIVVARVDGDYTVKRLRFEGRRTFLCSENPDYPAREITADISFEVWGVVTFSLRSLLCPF